jgi:hypothetical protein
MSQGHHTDLTSVAGGPIGVAVESDLTRQCMPRGFLGNGSAKLNSAPRRILIFRTRLMLRSVGVSFWHW